jgi:peptide-methionine (S)-S-oxide reductase
MIIPSYAILSAGNFWDLQKQLEQYTGIVSTLVGYTGGQTPNPTYQQIAEGSSDHVEAVKITYNQNLLSYEQILDIFFLIHNPYQLLPMSCHNTKLVKPTIFYLNETQQKIATAKRQQIQQQSQQQILTQIRPSNIFYPAAIYHQHYTIKPGQTSCCLTSEC